MQIGALDRIEGAVAEKLQSGHADEARFGFAARMANATPPVDEGFRQALRARILAELTENAESAHKETKETEEEWTRTAKARVRTIKLWRVSPGVAWAAILVLAALTLTLVVSWYAGMWKPDMEARTPPETETHTPPVGPIPQLESADVDALANRLNGAPAPRTVVVFPGDYAPALAGRVQHEVVPLTLRGTLAPAAIQAALGAALPPSGLVDVILIGQDATGAARQVRATLERRLYRLYRPGETGTEAFGALERNQYVVGPEAATVEPIGVVFENGVELVAAGVLDDPEPGKPLRLAFDWRVSEQVNDSVVVFAHLICDGGQLVAQRDAVPGNGMFPVESWEPGEVVRDQFALLLPPELPPGEYEVRVGIYNSTSGQRYRSAGEGGEPHVVVRQYTVED